MGEFADGQAVANGNWVTADKGGVLNVEDIARTGAAANGVGAIEHDKGNVVLCTGLHAHTHCVEIGIETHANVLDIKEHEFNFAEHLGAGLARFTVETVCGYASLWVLKCPDLFAVLRCSTDSVLGTK